MTSYRFARAHTVGVLGRTAVVAGLVVLATVLIGVVTAAVGGNLPDLLIAGLLVVMAVAVVLTVVAAARVLRAPTLLRLDQTGYHVRGLRGAGPTLASWTQVSRVRRERLAPGTCLVLSLDDGGRTVVPVRLLEGGSAAADQLESELRGRLDRAHGQRPLGPEDTGGGGGGI